MNKIKVLKMVLMTTLLTASVVAVGAIAWFIPTIMKHGNNTPKDDSKNSEFVTLNKSENTPVKLIENETNGKYFFGMEGLKKLNEKIKYDLQFGPEIEQLKSIRINNNSILNEGVLGQYSPATNEIEISIKHLVPYYNDLPIEQKINLIFPTIFHEYGHHFANTFITSIAKNDPNNNKSKINKNIPTKFLQAFEKSLHYSADANIGKNQNKEYVSSFKNAKTLYEESNNNGYLGLDDKNFEIQVPFWTYHDVLSLEFRITSNKYSYIFSIDELLTRKLQQITFIDKINEHSFGNETIQFTGNMIKNQFYLSTMAEDISRNVPITNTSKNTYEVGNDLILEDYPYGGDYKGTNRTITLPSTVDKLWKAYYDISGSDYGISQIYLKNIMKNNNDSEIEPKYQLKKENFEEIKFTGFLEGKQNKALILPTKNNGEKKILFVKNKYEYHKINAKKEILDKTWTLNKNNDKIGYTTEYESIKDIDTTKPIKVWTDENNNDKIEPNERKSLTISSERPTSTFRESLQSLYPNEPYYQIVMKGNDAFLQKYNINKSPLTLNSKSEIIGVFIYVTPPVDTIMFYSNYNERKY